MRQAVSGVISHAKSMVAELVKQTPPRLAQVARAIWTERVLFWVVAGLLLVDVGWTLWYGVAKYLNNTGTNTEWYALESLRITTEGGWPEWYNYAKTLGLLVLLGRLGERLRQPIYAALLILFGMFQLNDSLALHEDWGGYFVETFEILPRFGLPAQDVGELTTWALFGALLLPLLGLGLWRSDRSHWRNGAVLLVPFGLLLFCALFADQLFGAGILLDMIEDGGELVAITLACAFAAALSTIEGRDATRGDDAPAIAAEAAVTAPSRRAMVFGGVVIWLSGVLVMTFFNGFVVTSKSKYHSDLTQTPHWMGYHNDAFPADDLFAHYAAFNETLVQNAIHWFGTFFVDIVVLNRMLGVVVFGLTAVLFFVLVTRMSDPETGALAAFLFLVFPRSAYEIAGGFSKAWALGFVLLSVYIVQQRAWRIFPYAMPLAALCYPVSPVLMGAVVFCGIALEYFNSRSEAWRGFKYLVAGSLLGILPLLYKYLSPSPRIGKMIPTEFMKEKYRTGVSSEAADPLWEEVFNYIEQPFFLYSLVLVMVLAGARGVVWKRGWSALVLGSSISYMVADLVVPRLYLPNRYTRYSVAVILVLWFAHNWRRGLEIFQYRWVRRAAIAGVVVVAAFSFPDTFKPCDGSRSHGRWEDKARFEGLAKAVAEQSQPVLLAGHPYTLGHALVQSRRPVFLIDRMFHHWFDKFRETIDERAVDTYRAIYARDLESLNQLSSKHGVTHLVINKSDFSPGVVRSGASWRGEFRKRIAALARGSGRFLLSPPPRNAILFEDRWFWLIELPLEIDESGDVPGR